MMYVVLRSLAAAPSSDALDALGVVLGEAICRPRRARPPHHIASNYIILYILLIKSDQHLIN